MGQLHDSLSASVPPDQMAAIARLLGDTPEATARTLGLAVPTLLAALATKASHGEMDEVMALAEPLLADGDPLDRLAAGLADSSQRGPLMAEGHALADGLMGPQAGAFAAALAQAAGVRAHSAAEILKLAGPVAVGALHRHLGGALTADALAALLQHERPALMAMLPPALAGLAGSAAIEPQPLHGTAVEGAAGAAQSAGRWVPWLAATVVAIVLVASFRTFDTPGTAEPKAPASTAIITEAPVALARVDLPDGSVLMLPEGSSALQLARALSSSEGAPRSIRLTDLSWSASENSPDDAGAETVRAVARVLKAWPAARVRIEGHGDGTGDTATSLAESTTRAQAVADLLAADGVPAGNVSAKGVGNAEPIATTETAEGRAQNRRTLVIITAA
jgi:hypothetical protein